MISHIWIVIIASVLLLTNTGWSMAEGLAKEPEPIILRTSVEPDEEIWVGQRVILQVDVLVQDGWAKIKRARDFEVPGAFVVRLQTQGNRLEETIEGRTYSGQRYELSLFPQRGGTISVPSVPVEVEVKRWGTPAGDIVEHVKTPPVEFLVNVPPGAENIPELISTTKLEAEQQWEPDAQEFKVGDGTKRTVLLSGPDISGMAFTPLTFPPTDGLGIYPGEPSVDDHYERGMLTGKRTETVTYMFEREGSYELPEIVIPWWDMKNRDVKRAVLPALKLTVAPAPAGASMETGAVDDAAPGRWKMPPWLMAVIIILLVVLGVLWRYRQTLRFRWQRWQHERSEAEKAYFQRFKEASRSGDPKKAVNDLMHWLDRIHSGTGAARLDQFLLDFGDREARIETDGLMQSLGAADGRKWNGEALAEHMSEARSRWWRAQRQKTVLSRMLPPLNP